MSLFWQITISISVIISVVVYMCLYFSGTNLQREERIEAIIKEQAKEKRDAHISNKGK